ncbi:MAG: hypothetical protein ACJAZ9_001875 [Neolewinella sp.]|jgi:hypothetical protein
MSSKKVINSSTPTIAVRKGINGRITLDTETLAPPAPTNSIVPTGGVQNTISAGDDGYFISNCSIVISILGQGTNIQRLPHER